MFFFQTIIRQTPVFTFAKPACFGNIMAHAPAIFAGNYPAMTTFYCTSPEEALRRERVDAEEVQDEYRHQQKRVVGTGFYCLIEPRTEIQHGIGRLEGR